MPGWHISRSRSGPRQWSWNSSGRRRPPTISCFIRLIRRFPAVAKRMELQTITKVGLNINGDEILHTPKRIGQGEGETYRTYEIDNLLEISIACMMILVSSIIITWRVWAANVVTISLRWMISWWPRVFNMPSWGNRIVTTTSGNRRIGSENIKIIHISN